MSSVLPRGARVRLPTPALIDVAIATLAVLLIASPVLLTSDGFTPDFINAIWLVGHLVAVWATRRDPAFIDVVRRHLRYPQHLSV